MDLKGTIIVVNDTEQVSEKFQKREFVLEEVYNTRYGEHKNPVKMTATQEKCALLDEFPVGSKVEVSFDIDGRKWTNKDGEDVYFIDLRVWKIESAGKVGQPVTAHVEDPPKTETPAQGSGTPDDGDVPGNGPDDLPFQ